MLSFYFTTHYFEPENVMSASVVDVETNEVLYQKHFGVTTNIWQAHLHREVMDPTGLDPEEFNCIDIVELSSLFLNTDRIICMDAEAAESFLSLYKIGHAELFDLSSYFKYSRTKKGYSISDEPVHLRTMMNYCSLKGTLCTASRRAVAMAEVYKRLEVSENENVLMTTLKQDLQMYRLAEQEPYKAELISYKEEMEDLIEQKRDLLQTLSEIKSEEKAYKRKLRAELYCEEMSEEERQLIENMIRQETSFTLSTEIETLKSTITDIQNNSDKIRANQDACQKKNESLQAEIERLNDALKRKEDIKSQLITDLQDRKSALERIKAELGVTKATNKKIISARIEEIDKILEQL